MNSQRWPPCATSPVLKMVQMGHLDKPINKPLRCCFLFTTLGEEEIQVYTLKKSKTSFSLVVRWLESIPTSATKKSIFKFCLTAAIPFLFGVFKHQDKFLVCVNLLGNKPILILIRAVLFRSMHWPQLLSFLHNYVLFKVDVYFCGVWWSHMPPE